MAFELPSLKYSYDALEPHIDSKTMEIHHGKHHAGYTNNLNNAIKDSDLEGKSIEEILSNLNLDNSAVRNNGGGFYNHCLFWDILSPSGGGEPAGALSDAISNSFGSFDDFKTLFFGKLLQQDLALGGLGYVFILEENSRFVLQRIRITL